MCAHRCSGQSALCGVSCLLYMWVLGIKCRASGLRGRYFISAPLFPRLSLQPSLPPSFPIFSSFLSSFPFPYAS